MIQMGSKLLVADNTGAEIVMCVKVLGGSKKMSAGIGDMIVVSIRKAKSSTKKIGDKSVVKVKEGEVYLAVIVRIKKEIRRKDGTVLRFFENSAVLCNKQKELLGTRIFGVIPYELRDRGYLKIISLATEVA